ncbi:MAG: MBL fold metallo-hydrolase [Acetobacteraceae bacterium]|nr:MBL fold metallo-hydrolase [Acetobacteraceae bacterium]MBV8575691.1 MBL fold metallo-hydrolase [Acetobacteraceae bacterium]
MFRQPTILATRRQALATVAAGAAALTLPRAARAKMPMNLPQAPQYYRFKLGNAECTIITDGLLPLGNPEDSFIHIDKAEIARELQDNFLPLHSANLEQNVLVVNFGDRVVLFDTGMGTDKLFGDSTGKMMPGLHQAGIDPSNVDAVVMSHAHIDHCGGLVVDGKPNFPNAQYFIGEPDFDYWTSDEKIPKDYPARPHFLNQARNNLLPVKDRTTFYKDGQEIVPGVTALSAPGHTVSHTIFMINSGNDQLCYIADLAHHPVLLLERPRTHFKYDTDPAQSAESRVRYMTMFADNRIPILAYHFAWPGIGHVAKQGDGFRYIPAPEHMESVKELNS